MSRFRYQAMTVQGDVIRGVLDAASEAAAIQQLRALGHYPMSASSTEESGWRALMTSELRLRRHLRLRDLAVASRELATLLQAGLPLDGALATLAGLGESAPLRRSIEASLARVKDGAGLADAFAADPAFPRLYVSMVRAGEMGGSLDVTLRHLADYCARAQAVREAVTSALVYPAILVATAGLSMIFILVFVLPEFEAMFRSAGRQLPLATRIVMGIGHFIGRYWWVILTAALALALGAKRALRRPAIRLRWDQACLGLPIIGNLIVKMEMERFSRTLGVLLRNGTALPTALGITRTIIGNSVIGKVVADTQTSLREGEGLADRLARTRVFPTMVLDFIRVGEQTGKLDEMLLHQAELQEQSIKHRIERLMALLVPLLTIFLGMVVAALVASMLVAILSINDLAVR